MITQEGTVKWGILGCAGIARRALIPALQKADNASLVAIASREEAKARTWANQYKIERAYGNYEALLDDPEIQAIYNPLPNSLHKEWTIKAAAKGKHVLCEKPLGVTPAECQEMIHACHQYGVLLMEAFMYRFHPRTLKVKELIETGTIGALRLIKASFSVPQSDLQNVRLRKDLAGGSLMDLGCYCVNVSRFLTAAEPTEVYATIEYGEQSQVDEGLAALLLFPGGILAGMDCSFRMARRQHYEVVGAQGTIYVPQAYVPGNEAADIVLTVEGQTDTLTIPGIDQYQLEVEHFSECILAGKQPRYVAEDGTKNMRVIEALYQSGRTKQPVSLV